MQETVDALTPQLRTRLESLPAEIPVIFFGLDNSTFMCEDGSMCPLKKIPESGSGHHAVGELIVAPRNDPSAIPSPT